MTKNSLEKVFLLLLVVVCGCRQETEKSPVVQSIERDIKRIPNMIAHPMCDTLGFGNALCEKIKGIEEPRLIRSFLKKFEHAVYTTPVNSTNYEERIWQAKAFAGLADALSMGVRLTGGTEEEYWEKRLLMARAMQQQIRDLETLQNVPDDNRPPRGGIFCSRKRCVRMLRDENEFRTRLMEENFNQHTSKWVSPERAAAIRARIEKVIGRKVRTMEEIAQARWGRKNKVERTTNSVIRLRGPKTEE